MLPNCKPLSQEEVQRLADQREHAAAELASHSTEWPGFLGWLFCLFSLELGVFGAFVLLLWVLDPSPREPWPGLLFLVASVVAFIMSLGRRPSGDFVRGSAATGVLCVGFVFFAFFIRGVRNPQYTRETSRDEAMYRREYLRTTGATEQAADQYLRDLNTTSRTSGRSERELHNSALRSALNTYRPADRPAQLHRITGGNPDNDIEAVRAGNSGN